MILETYCKDCVFAIYEGKTQIGCEAKIIDKYKELGVQVDECYDEDADFYVIRNKICVFKRKKKISLEEVKRQIRPSFNAVVFVDEGGDTEKMRTTMDSLIGQKLKPDNIIFAVKNPKIKLQDVNSEFGENFVYKDVRYCVSNIFKDIKSVDDIVFSVSSLLKGQWVAIFNCGYEVPDNYLSSIDKALNEDMKTILYIEASDNNGVVMNASAYHYFYTVQNQKTILENIKETAPHVVFRKEDIWQKECACSQELTAENLLKHPYQVSCCKNTKTKTCVSPTLTT